MNFFPFPVIDTNRLQLRQLKKEDAPIIYFLRTDKEVNKFIKRPETKNIEDTLVFIATIDKGIKNNEWIYWCITLKDNPNVIGTIGLRNFVDTNTIAEVGYDLHPDFHKKGIMTEALKAVLNYGFETLNLKEIEACTHRKNEASKNLLVANNFMHLPNRIDAGFIDNMIFSIKK